MFTTRFPIIKMAGTEVIKADWPCNMTCEFISITVTGEACCALGESPLVYLTLILCGSATCLIGVATVLSYK